jgi:hypothetical protein
VTFDRCFGVWPFAAKRCEMRRGHYGACGPLGGAIAPPVVDRDALVRAVHEAMQNAPHDGLPYRQARAAVDAVAAWRREMGK